ncbi:hypothetical protein RchiOBHm_Chr3g0476201 [Rosa chinensis]|uniref:Uncharacterized protein n=1 Tax=Rosa chinensis TaxID=74649 RepID=A0A2P6RCK9_ROSCH|nr:hypothetical protein RchiOBHm_Chr3g0476201 [Rosa chinensis]
MHVFSCSTSKPIVSQLFIEPPVSLEEHVTFRLWKKLMNYWLFVSFKWLTAGSDLLWKPLNYEVMFLYIIVSTC